MIQALCGQIDGALADHVRFTESERFLRFAWAGRRLAACDGMPQGLSGGLNGPYNRRLADAVNHGQLLLCLSQVVILEQDLAIERAQLDREALKGFKMTFDVGLDSVFFPGGLDAGQTEAFEGFTLLKAAFA